MGYFKGLKNQSQLCSTTHCLAFLFIMAKLKIANKYATVPNLLLNDSNISLKAKGLYAFIQSKPDNWDFSAERISSQLKEGLPSIKSSLQELERFGFLKRDRYQNIQGYWEVEYTLFENPAVGFLPLGNPTEENPIIGKPSNNTNKDFSKKDSIDTIIIKKKERFLKSLEVFRFDLGNEFEDFYEYWSEPNQKNGKLRFEDQKFFEISKRIRTWLSNSTKFKNNGTNNEQKLGTSAARMEALRKW